MLKFKFASSLSQIVGEDILWKLFEATFKSCEILIA